MKIWILHSWEGDSKNVHPEEMIIDRGEAEVDNHFRRVNILIITHSWMYYLFYYTEITIRQETLRESCWWGRCGFLGETKSFVKTAQIWFQNVRLDLIKKTSTHTWWSFTNSGIIGILMRRNVCFRHCNRTSDRSNPYAHQCCACDMVEIIAGWQ